METNGVIATKLRRTVSPGMEKTLILDLIYI